MDRDADSSTGSSSDAACPVCGVRRSIDFYAVEAAPVTCASIFQTREEALAVPQAKIDLAVCGACSFAFNRAFDPVLGELGARYESSQGASSHFGAFAESLATQWIQQYRLAGENVIEVGCGGGDFLTRLIRGGVREVTGIDPLGVEPSGSDSSRLRVIPEEFGERHFRYDAKALVCRHTLEHIRDVSGFLQLLHAWASARPERVLLFELPAAERVFAERAFWDIYYEHCNYFTEQTARYAFEKAGFEVLSARRVYDGQYLIIEASARAASASTSVVTPESAASAYRDFARDVRASIHRCEQEIERLHAESPPVLLWQGAAKTVGFLAVLENADVIRGAIDLNRQRSGKFLPGSGLQVWGPEELVTLRPGNIVLMNPVYLDEVRASVKSMGLDVPVLPVNDLLGT